MEVDYSTADGGQPKYVCTNQSCNNKTASPNYQGRITLTWFDQGTRLKTYARAAVVKELAGGIDAAGWGLAGSQERGLVRNAIDSFLHKRYLVTVSLDSGRAYCGQLRAFDEEHSAKRARVE